MVWLVVQAALRDPAAILSDPATVRLIGFGEPVAILLMAVVHFVVATDHRRRIVAS